MNTNISINEVDRLFLKIQKQKQELEKKYTCASKILEEKVNKVFSQYFIGELDEIKSKLEIFYPNFQMNNYECFDKETLGICFKGYLVINSLTKDDLYILGYIKSDVLNEYNKDLQILLNMICDLEDEKTIDYKDFRYIKSKYFKETYKNFFVKVDDFLQYVQSMLFDCLLGISKVATN